MERVSNSAHTDCSRTAACGEGTGPCVVALRAENARLQTRVEEAEAGLAELKQVGNEHYNNRIAVLETERDRLQARVEVLTVERDLALASRQANRLGLCPKHDATIRCDMPCPLCERDALQARVEEAERHIRMLDERGMQASLYVRLCYERDRYKAHMGEAWQEYKRLWLRWFEQRVEYRYAKKREREASALAERRKKALAALLECGSIPSVEDVNRCYYCETEMEPDGHGPHAPECAWVLARAAIEEEVR